MCGLYYLAYLPSVFPGFFFAVAHSSALSVTHSHCTATPHFGYPFVTLSTFRLLLLLETVNNDEVSICAQVLSAHLLSSYQGVCLEGDLLAHRIVLSSLLGNC